MSVQEKNRIGQTLGNYRLEKLLGKGGYANVYLAVHIHLGIQAAIKVLKLQEELDDQEQINFLSEAKHMKSLDHSNIVKLYDYGIEMNQKNHDSSTPYLVMEYAPDGTLRHLCPHGERMPFPKIALYIKQIAAGLQYAHNNNITHLDVKPENMLVRRSDDIALSDFGIAVAGFNTTNLAVQQAELVKKMVRGEQVAVPGTAPYLAPERLQGYTQRASDQYSLGVVAYEWLCGRRPFEGTTLEICHKLITDPPPSLKKINPTISPQIEQVVLKALAKDPSARYETVAAFAQALDTAIQASSPDASPKNTPVKPAQLPDYVPLSPIRPAQAPDPVILQANPVRPPDFVSPPIRPVQLPNPVTPTPALVQPVWSPDFVSPPINPVRPPDFVSPPIRPMQSPDPVTPSPVQPVRSPDLVSPPPVRPAQSSWSSPPPPIMSGPVSSFNPPVGMGQRQIQLPPSPTQSGLHSPSEPTFDNVLGVRSTPKVPREGFAGIIDEISGVIDESATKTKEIFVSDRYFVKTRRTRNFRLVGIPLNILSALIVLFTNVPPANIILAVLGGAASIWFLFRCTISLKKPIAITFGLGVALWWGLFVAAGVTKFLPDPALAFPICFLVFAASLAIHVWYVYNRLKY